MKTYLETNLEAYEKTAEEFQQKKAIRLAGDTRIADQFAGLFKSGAKILELGTGSGQLARLLCERGLNVEAIEYAPKMAELAAKTAPQAHIIVDEFLGHDFKETCYDGIIGVAFVHLFTDQDAHEVMQKLYSLLHTDGYLMLATTIHEKTYDDIVRKTNFKTVVSRFRRHYTAKDFKKLFEMNGFTIINSTLVGDKEVEGKQWINVIGGKIGETEVRA